MCSFQERNVCSLSKLLCSLFFAWGNVLTLQTAHRNFLILCQIVSHSNINFLISKQNKAPKTVPKILKQYAGIAILRYVLSFTQTNIALQSNKQINKYLYWNELHLFPALFLFWFQWYTEEVFMFGIYLVPISIHKLFKRHIKLHSDFH